MTTGSTGRESDELEKRRDSVENCVFLSLYLEEQQVQLVVSVHLLVEQDIGISFGHFWEQV